MSAAGPYRSEDLSVIIPTRQRWEVLERCLDALTAQTVTGFEVIVVADGRDQHPDLGLHADRTTLLVQDHAGPGVARNLGAAHSSRPLLLLMGDDMMAAADLVERHLAAHTRRPSDRDAVLGLVEWHADVARGAIQRWLDWSAVQFDFASIENARDEPAPWAHFYSSNVSLKRALFEEAGGFDPDFRFLYEDIDLGWRLSEAGMRLWFEPGAVTRHDHRYDWPALLTRFETTGRAERLMVAKHPWFQPWFHDRVDEALSAPPPAPWWPAVVDRLPPGPRRDHARNETNRWYFRQLGPYFLNAWEAERDIEELTAYLGDGFDISRLHRHEHHIEKELEDAPDEDTFYRTSQMYVYDLTAFASWRTKVPYREDVLRYSPPGARLLDYGCGIGTDGLRLTERGYRVDFADFDNPSTRYLRWRLERRGIEAHVYDIDHPEEGPPLGSYHLAYSFDVIEHVADPFAFLEALESTAALVAVNFLEPDPNDTHLHHALPIPALLDHAERRGLVRYRLYNDRSHFVIYRSGRTPTANGRRTRATSALRRRVGVRLPSVIGRWRPELLK